MTRLTLKATGAFLKGRKADAVFTDPPYNVPINGHVSGKGKAQHQEFAMASGEMSDAEFEAFLTTMATRLVEHTVSGSVHFIFMDWRHARPLLNVGHEVYTDLLNICVWNKTNGGMGSLYRSKHELAFVFKNGKAPHQNNVELGRFGRYRANVWDYAGVNTFWSERDTELAMHPTVKPVAMIADAILDVTKRGGLVLEPFSGSGSTILAGERTGLWVAAIELDPRHLDVAIRRFEAATGKQATLIGDGRSFNDIEQARLGEASTGEAS